MDVVVEMTRRKRQRYVARCPSLPGCRAHGRSRSEALERIDPAIRGYITSLNRPAPVRIKKQVVTPE